MEIEHSDERSGIATGDWPDYPSTLDASGAASRAHPGGQQRYDQVRLGYPAGTRDRDTPCWRRRAG